MLQAVIFDFDGTLADTKDVLASAYPKLAEKHGYEVLSMDELEKLKHYPLHERIKKLGVPLYKIPVLIREGREMVGEHMATCSYYAGVPDMVHALAEKDLFLGIISSNSESNIRKFLDAHNLNLFHDIDNTHGLFGKYRVMRRFLKKHGFSPEEVIYVGDELRDIENCKKVFIKVIAATWGYDGYDLLKQSEPDYMANEPEEILPIIEELLV